MKSLNNLLKKREKFRKRNKIRIAELEKNLQPFLWSTKLRRDLSPINLTEHATGLLVSGLLLKSRRKDTQLRKSYLHKLISGLTLNEIHHIESYCLQKRDRLGKLSGQDRLLLECIHNIGEIGRMNILKKSNFGK